MVEDLKSMLAIDKSPGRVGACNFPIALYTLSCMDYLGFLVAKDVYSIKGKDTQKRISSYAGAFFPDAAKKELADRWERVTNIFRHGLSHVFFPKQGGVSRADSQNIIAEVSGATILDADALARAFVESTGELEKSLLSDDALCERIFDRQQLLNDDAEKTNTKMSTVAVSPSTQTTASSGPSSDVTATLQPKT